MLESLPRLDELQPEEAMKAGQTRVRRIAEAAFWDSLAGMEALHYLASRQELQGHA